MRIMQEHSLKRREPELIGDIIRDAVRQGILLPNLKGKNYES